METSSCCTGKEKYDILGHWKIYGVYQVINTKQLQELLNLLATELFF